MAVEFESRGQTARKRLEALRNLSKEITEFKNKEQTARKRRENFRRRSKPLEEL